MDMVVRVIELALIELQSMEPNRRSMQRVAPAKAQRAKCVSPIMAFET
jgi:hypothetical protein